MYLNNHSNKANTNMKYNPSDIDNKQINNEKKVLTCLSSPIKPFIAK